MRYAADGRRATAFFRAILPGGNDFHSVRRGSDFFVSVGICVSRFAVVRLRGDDAVHRDTAGGIRLSVEKRRAGLEKVGAISVREKHPDVSENTSLNTSVVAEHLRAWNSKAISEVLE